MSPEPVREFLHVKKRELPMPLVIEGDDGRIEIIELAPAGPKKLGAYTRGTADWIKQRVRLLLGRK